MVVYCFDYFVAVIVVTVDVTFGSGKAVFVSLGALIPASNNLMPTMCRSSYNYCFIKRAIYITGTQIPLCTCMGNPLSVTRY